MSIATGDVGASVALKDVSHDGNPDLVTTGWYGVVSSSLGATAGNLLSVALGNNAGTFGTARVFRGDRSPIGVAFGDFNGDGAIDIVTANQDSDSVTVYLNDGFGNFGNPQGLAVGQANATTNAVVNQAFSAFEDVNGDGARDVTYLEYSNGVGLVTLINDGAGHFGAPIRSPFTTTSNYLGGALLGDFRSVGRKDFLAVGQDTAFTNGGQFILYARANGDGTFQAPTLTAQTGASGQIALGDFNGDGRPDFVTAYGDPIHITLFLNNGDGTFTAGNTVVANATSSRWADQIFVGDFNRDGKLDVLVHSPDNELAASR